jgi:hypothetical protein
MRLDPCDYIKLGATISIKLFVKGMYTWFLTQKTVGQYLLVWGIESTLSLECEHMQDTLHIEVNECKGL